MKKDFLSEIYSYPLEEYENLGIMLKKSLVSGIISQSDYLYYKKYMIFKKEMIDRQNYKWIESAKETLEKMPESPIKVLYCKLIADQYYFSCDFLNAMVFYLKGIQVSSSILYFDFLGIFYVSIAMASFELEEFQFSLLHLENALGYSLEEDSFYENLYPFLCEYVKNRLENSQDRLDNLNELFEKNKNKMEKEEMAAVYLIFAAINSELKNYETSISFNQKVLEMRDKVSFLKYSERITKIYFCIIRSSYLSHNYHDVLIYSKIAENELQGEKYSVLTERISFYKVDSLLKLDKKEEAYSYIYQGVKTSSKSFNQSLNNLGTILDVFVEKISYKERCFREAKLLYENNESNIVGKKENSSSMKIIERLNNIETINYLITGDERIDRFYDILLRELPKIIDFESFLIGYLDEDNDIIKRGLVVFENMRYRSDNMPVKLFPKIKKLMDSGEKVLVSGYNNMTYEDSNYFVRNLVKYNSTITVMLRDDKGTFGFISVQHTQNDYYKEIDVDLFEFFAHIIAGKTSLLLSRYELSKEKVRVVELNQLLQLSKQKQEYLTYVDELTGLYNSDGLDLTLDELFEYEGGPIDFIIVTIDIDRFRSFNKKYGNMQGDNYLRQVAYLLKTTFNIGNIIASRLGDDEFVLLIYENSIEKIIPLLEEFARSFDKYGNMFYKKFVNSSSILLYKKLIQNKKELHDIIDESLEIIQEERNENKSKSTIRVIDGNK